MVALEERGRVMGAKSYEVKRNSTCLHAASIAALLLAVVALAISLKRLASDERVPERSAMEQIRAERVLRVGYIVAPPWIIREPDSGELSGSSVDAIRRIAELGDLEVQFEEATWDTFVAGLQSYRFDVSIAPTFATIERSLSVAFTSPQGYFGNSAVVRKSDDRFQQLEDIDQEGVVVAVTQGEQGQEYAKRSLRNATIRVISAGEQALTFAEVLANRADVALGDAWFVAQFVEQHDGARDLLADRPYNVTAVAWAVRQEDGPLLHFINASLEHLDATGFIDTVNAKYEVPLLQSPR